MVINTLLVFLGGGIGASARYLLSNSAHRVIGSDFPYGTLLANIAGCFFIGLLMTAFEERFLINPSLRIFLTIGILGGFTTFSSFSYETMMMLKGAEYWNAGLNISLNLFVSLAATFIGVAAGKLT